MASTVVSPELANLEGMIGNVEVAVLHDCTLHDVASHWFPGFELESLLPHQDWLCPYHIDAQTGAFEMPVHSFVLRTGHHVILIDTCVGDQKDRPLVYEMHQLSTGYLTRLEALGLSPEDVDYVMCTHLHLDHVGWNTRLLDGRWVPTFPNAKYVISRAEYEATQKDAANPNMLAAFRNSFNDSVLPVVEAGQVEFVDGVHEMLDGFTLRPAPGHSQGHVRIELRSGEELGVFAGDLLHSPLQIPLWEQSSLACWDRQLAAATRRELLEFCSEENALLLPGHFKAPFVGRIHRDGDRFAIGFGW